MDLSSRMPGVWLALHDEGGKYQGVARVLKYEGHMLVYDPQTNGTGWVAMRGIPSSLTEVELQSAGKLGNFYPIPSAVPSGPMTTRSPPEDPTWEYKQQKTETLRPMAGDLDEYINWDTDDVQNRSHTPSPTMVINKPTQGESAEETPPTRQNIHLVSEHVIKPKAVLCQVHTPVTEEDKPQDDSASMDKEQPDLMILWTCSRAWRTSSPPLLMDWMNSK